MVKNCHIIILATFILLLTGVSCTAETFPGKAITTAESFANKIDAALYEDAYDKAAALLQNLNTKEDWIKQIKPLRSIMGPVVSRSVKAIKKTVTYPGLPDGHYVMVYFETEMENKKKAAEVALMKQNGNIWQVCLYSLK